MHDSFMIVPWVILALAQVDSATSSDAGAENEEDEDEEDGKKKLSKRH